jgi:two-component system chemotaxis response regulator CheY
MRILIVDDSLLAEHALKSYFMKLGHEIVGIAKNGDIAKEMFHTLNPEIVTVDQVMPGSITGTDLVKYINKKDKEEGKQTHLLMITADDLPEEIKIDLKVSAYILKPVTLLKVKYALDSIK